MRNGGPRYSEKLRHESTANGPSKNHKSARKRLTVTTYFLVDDLNPTGYPQVVEELSGAGAVAREYTYGVQRIDENQPISNVWTASFYQYDGMGNVRALTDVSGTVTDTWEYDALWATLVTHCEPFVAF